MITKIIPVPTTPPMRQDGVYQVTTRYLCAGLVIRQGQVTRCAPILRRRLAYWLSIAVQVGT